MRLTRAAGYVNAGTVEFLYQPSERSFAFLEVNTRLQVEHPVTELTTGLDLVKLQLHVAAGGRLADTQPTATAAGRRSATRSRRGSTPRIRSEASLPRPARSRRSPCPLGPGMRVDTGVAEGDVIPPEYDSMIAKVIAWGHDRPEALARLWRALCRHDRHRRRRDDQQGVPPRPAGPPGRS